VLDASCSVRKDKVSNSLAISNTTRKTINKNMHLNSKNNLNFEHQAVFELKQNTELENI